MIRNGRYRTLPPRKSQARLSPYSIFDTSLREAFVKAYTGKPAKQVRCRYCKRKKGKREGSRAFEKHATSHMSNLYDLYGYYEDAPVPVRWGTTGTNVVNSK